MILVHKIGIRRIPYKKCLGISNKIGSKARGGSSEKKYYVVQFGDVNFYRFLLSIGLKPKKSKILGALGIEKKYFADFFRGCIDGDGSINTLILSRFMYYPGVEYYLQRKYKKVKVFLGE